MEFFFTHNELISYIEDYFPIHRRNILRPGHEFVVKKSELYSSTYEYYINNSEMEMMVVTNTNDMVLSFYIKKSMLITRGIEKFEIDFFIIGNKILSSLRRGYEIVEESLNTIDDIKKYIHDYFFELYPDEVRETRLRKLLE